MNNALTEIKQLPQFSNIKIKDIEPTINKIINDNTEKLEKILKSEQSKSWHSFIQELEKMDNILSRAGHR